ncbi:DUF2182 domain-containing protein [Janthinobacterium aquaticum]|uniref:DUF2182 domain-containing protein n=1 Tax=Janthinobacterium sp. FT58W TaxID=2654254 RepID=UPI001263E90E|nr:DUF2182 domain-containing protein [Janthinobacterium sp. FT58W]KAB8044386.1 hypothetical protein GCM43_04055 [Janthinobacterium sp. FT58W]
MFYNKNVANRIQRYLFAVSGVALLVIFAPSLWAGPEPVAIMCGSGWIAGSKADWILSAGTGWLLMVVAMMTPLNLQPILHIRISSFSDRQWRSTLIFLAGYLAIWLLGGYAIKVLELMVSRSVREVSVQAGAFALIACVWQASPFKQKCLNACHSHRPLAAFGRAADIDALRFGLEHGMWCLGSCWALMLFADSLVQWHLAGMIAVSLLMYCERMDAPAYPAWKLRGFQAACQRLRHGFQVYRHRSSSSPARRSH